MRRGEAAAVQRCGGGRIGKMGSAQRRAAPLAVANGVGDRESDLDARGKRGCPPKNSLLLGEAVPSCSAGRVSRVRWQ